MFVHSDWFDDVAEHGLAPPTPYFHYLRAELKKVDTRVAHHKQLDLIRLIALERQVHKSPRSAWQVSKMTSRHGLQMPPWAGKLLEDTEASYWGVEPISLDVALGFRSSRDQRKKKGNKKHGPLAREIYAQALDRLCWEVWLLNRLHRPAVSITKACSMVACRAKAEHRGEGLVVRVKNLKAGSLRLKYYAWKKRYASMLAVQQVWAKACLDDNRDERLAEYRV